MLITMDHACFPRSICFCLSQVRAPLQDTDPRWSFLPTEHQVPSQSTQEDNSGSAKAPTGKWFFVSDSRVSEVGEERVLRSQAYLLFYERFW
jgi:hypothetical protein